MFKYALITFAAALIGAHLSPVQGQEAEDISVAEASTRIDIAGRQRMLSQRMAKAACLMSQDISFATSYDELTQAYNLFQQADSALREGSEDMELAPESFPEVVDALKAIDEPWSNYKTIIESGIDDGTIESENLDVLDQASLGVLKYMNIAVFKTARAYATALDDVPLGLAITIDVAGRQRMLTQKAVKEACLMAISASSEDHADRLAETIELFDLSLKSLRDGYEDVGVIAAPNREIDRKLLEVQGLWEPVKVILDRAAEGEVLPARDLGRLARQSEPLLRTMNEAVGMYGQ